MSSHNAYSTRGVEEKNPAPVLFTKAASWLRGMVHKLAIISQSIFEHPLLHGDNKNVSTYTLRHSKGEDGDRPHAVLLLTISERCMSPRLRSERTNIESMSTFVLACIKIFCDADGLTLNITQHWKHRSVLQRRQAHSGFILASHFCHFVGGWLVLTSPSLGSSVNTGPWMLIERLCSESILRAAQAVARSSLSRG